MTESTEIAVHEPKAELVGGGEVVRIVPRNVEEMFRLAAAIHGSGLAPKTLDSKEKVFVAVMAGAELGLPPHQAVQSFYVVNNRPTLWGDAIPALLWSNGFKLKEWFEGEGDQMIARCEVTRPSGDVIPGEFSMEDARKAKLITKDGPWQTAPKRMLKMRARAFAARDGAADVLKGFQVREEVEDYQTIRETRPQISDLRTRLEANKTPPTEGFTVENGTHEPETAEEVLAEVELPVTNTEVEADRPQAEPAPLVDATLEPEAATPVSAPTTATDAGTQAIGGDTTSEAETPATEPHAPTTALSAVNAAVDAYIDRINAAKTKIKLTALRDANLKLRNALAEVDPERAAALDNIWNTRWAEIEAGNA